MRYLIVSDMHGNSDAFDAVLRRVRRKRLDATLMLGDLVGYGAAPNQVIEAMAKLPGRVWSVRGNHDKVVAGLESGDSFNDTALEAARWSARVLSSRNMRLVKDLPEGPVEVGEGITICHGSPLEEDDYIFSAHDALEVFAGHPGGLTFLGHTHLPSLFVLRDKTLELVPLRDSGVLRLDPEARYLINPGSIGQPRDHDPRASYMIYNSDRRELRWYRVDYPVERAQRRISKAGLPPILAERLALGY